MNLLLREDGENIVLVLAALLRPFYELSARLHWASLVLLTVGGGLSSTSPTKYGSWAQGCKDSPDPRLAKLEERLLERHQAEEVRKWRNADGSTIRCS